MAKRKAPRRAAGAKKKARKTAPQRRSAQARKAARKTSTKSKASARKTAPKPRKAAAAKRAAPKRVAAPKRAATPKKTAAPKRTVARKTTRKAKAEVPVRKAPSLNRPRRSIVDEDIVASPPSSLDLDRSASAVRTGRRILKERYAEHTETSPALTGGDVDADWESAFSVGDEAPGGDNPTPDQDIVDDIGRAVGIEYQDNEELKGANKVEQRDKKRWELDPASSEDWKDR